MDVCTPIACVEVRGQLLGVSFLLPPGETLGSNVVVRPGGKHLIISMANHAGLFLWALGNELRSSHLRSKCLTELAESSARGQYSLNSFQGCLMLIPESHRACSRCHAQPSIVSNSFRVIKSQRNLISSRKPLNHSA